METTTAESQRERRVKGNNGRNGDLSRSSSGYEDPDVPMQIELLCDAALGWNSTFGGEQLCAVVIGPLVGRRCCLVLVSWRSKLMEIPTTDSQRERRVKGTNERDAELSRSSPGEEDPDVPMQI